EYLDAADLRVGGHERGVHRRRRRAGVLNRDGAGPAVHAAKRVGQKHRVGGGARRVKGADEERPRVGRTLLVDDRTHWLRRLQHGRTNETGGQVGRARRVKGEGVARGRGAALRPFGSGLPVRVIVRQRQVSGRRAEILYLEARLALGGAIEDQWDEQRIAGAWGGRRHLGDRELG